MSWSWQEPALGRLLSAATHTAVVPGPGGWGQEAGYGTWWKTVPSQRLGAALGEVESGDLSRKNGRVEKAAPEKASIWASVRPVG